MLGICADDAATGVATLKRWVEGLRLPKGRLHGMDRDGVPLDMDGFGPVYIKYNSGTTSTGSSAGDAMLNGYGGSFRGVYFNPSLPDGEFRQYAVLPLSLFPSLPGASSAPSPAGLSEAAVRAALAGIQPALGALGATLRVVDVDPAAGKVRPPRLAAALATGSGPHSPRRAGHTRRPARPRAGTGCLPRAAPRSRGRESYITRPLHKLLQHVRLRLEPDKRPVQEARLASLGRRPLELPQGSSGRRP